jgi:hypothetical protein
MSAALLTVLAIRIFTNSGTYVPTAGMSSCLVEMVGSGGMGGSAAYVATGTVSVGSGGGAGGYVRALLSNTTVGSSQGIVIGQDTSFGSILTAYGGSSGTTKNYANVIVSGGAGGSTWCSVPCLAINGQVGGSGYGDWAGFSESGSGASSMLGSGGASVFVGGPPFSSNGVDATGYGAGGSGAASGNNYPGANGGSGSQGVVIITEY